MNASLFSDWKLAASAGYGESRNDSTRTYLTVVRPLTFNNLRNTLATFEANTDGTLFSTGAGRVKAALGGGYREETFRDLGGGITGRRNVKYFFGEITAPLVCASDTRAGLQELDLNLAARTEDYSDFGSTTNPKIGLRYKPVGDLTFRATWGKSFKAPRMFQLYQSNDVSLVDASTFGGASGSTVLFSSGGNSRLAPERATSWTAGGEFTPHQFPTMRLAATYYSIDFDARVVSPFYSLADALTNPIYVPFIGRAPTPAAQQDVISRASTFSNFTSGDYNPANVVAILYASSTNATSQKINGVDLSYEQTFTTAIGNIEPFANVSWLNLKQKTVPTLPAQKLSGLVDNAPSFKARFGTTFERDGLSTTGTVNYIGELTDTSINPNRPVSSWTTVDLNIAYRFSERSGIARGFKFSISATNLFDRAPPFVASSGLYYAGVFYDASNHSAVGRFVSFSLSKAW